MPSRQSKNSQEALSPQTGQNSPMVALDFAWEVLDKLDGWVNELARPLLPPKRIPVGDRYLRLEFRHHLPPSVMIGKLVRAVSALRAARSLAQSGYITESGSLLRMVSDFCTEIQAIGESVHGDGTLPKAVQEFVNQYFQPRALTADEYDKAEKVRYVSREELMKADVRRAAAAGIDGEDMRKQHRYVNMAYDSYVHGAYETTMELYDPRTEIFQMRGHQDMAVRDEHEEAVALKLVEVVSAIEVTAAVAGAASVFEGARESRRAMMTRAPWKLES